jgi:hypothetical protein
MGRPSSSKVNGVLFAVSADGMGEPLALLIAVCSWSRSSLSSMVAGVSTPSEGINDSQTKQCDTRPRENGGTDVSL